MIIYSFVCEECGVYVTQDCPSSCRDECSDCESERLELEALEALED